MLLIDFGEERQSSLIPEEDEDVADPSVIEPVGIRQRICYV
jgi:hypothetical protein